MVRDGASEYKYEDEDDFRPPHQPHGSTLIVTLATLTALSLMAAMTFTRVMPRFRMALNFLTPSGIAVTLIFIIV